MADLSIKLKIADREYPMKVQADDEARIRKAAKLLNERIKFYRDKFGLEDNQDLLAMVAFDAIVDRMKREEEQEQFEQDYLQKIHELNNMLQQAL